MYKLFKEQMKTVFNINDMVYHKSTPDQMGVVVDICYYYATDLFLYQVAFNNNLESLWYYSNELTKEKPIYQ
jgi:hypothetical protein